MVRYILQIALADPPVRHEEQLCRNHANVTFSMFFIALRTNFVKSP
jgi:hypothetical protein